ncbi:Mariner Mos1 transposase [Caligus rogercresseyi]|uniref:Mariner Mos1 transposase n=1 Tax=Caligus rogercresseyi TaxID=217165 RepID=A0A7T8GMG8_CALRO|nr:Mariner Mos1 transposase [Caligus rogercresseyi]
MSSFVPSKVFFRGVLLDHFNMKKKAAESYRIFMEVYGEYALAVRTCQKRFARFKSGNFDLDDEECSGAPPKVENAELEELLDQDSAQTQEELAETLGVINQLFPNVYQPWE